MADYINKIRTTEGDKPVNYEALANKPNSLPNPNKIKFTGSVVAEYDGSSEVTVNIQNGASEEQAAQIQTNTNDISELKNKTSELKSEIDNYIPYSGQKNLLNTLCVSFKDNYFDSYDYGNSNHENYCVFYDIPVKSGKTYVFSDNARYVIMQNIEKTRISGAGSGTKDAGYYYTPNQDGYISVCFNKNVTNNYKVFDRDENMFNIENLYNAQDETTEKYNKNVLAYAEFTKNYYLDQYGNAHANNRYSMFKIPYKANKVYHVYPKSRFITLISDIQMVHSLSNDSPTEIDVSHEGNGYLYVTFYNDDLDNAVVYEDGADIKQIYSFKVTEEPKDNLFKDKLWVACGDSFTEGGYTSADLNDDNVFRFGTYNGKQKTYPYFIGIRTGLKVINEAVSGSCMTYIPDNHESWRNGCFALDRYKNIPQNADYITLYFGINDDNYNAPLGSIDDTDITTFYGAWNTCLEYLITNHPYSKIGVIITNGSSPQYTDAERNVCKKWGIPYLDMEQDLSVPLMHRVTERDGLCEQAKTLRLNAFKISQYNTHPNIKAHEYESTFIENFLRSL